MTACENSICLYTLCKEMNEDELYSRPLMPRGRIDWGIEREIWIIVSFGGVATSRPCLVRLYYYYLFNAHDHALAFELPSLAFHSFNVSMGKIKFFSECFL